jgi:hypothetical protein
LKFVENLQEIAHSLFLLATAPRPGQFRPPTNGRNQTGFLKKIAN